MHVAVERRPDVSLGRVEAVVEIFSHGLAREIRELRGRGTEGCFVGLVREIVQLFAYLRYAGGVVESGIVDDVFDDWRHALKLNFAGDSLGLESGSELVVAFM